MQRNRVVIKAAIVIFLSGGIIFFGAARPIQLARNGIISLFRPLMSVARSAGRRLGAQVEYEEVRRLTEENQRLTAENFDRERLARDLAALESALAFRDAAGLPLTGGRVLSYANELGREVLVIDQGMAAGIKKGDAVVDERGALVGEVDEAGDDFSRVLVSSNSAVMFPAFLLPGGGSMLARGMGARAFSVELIPRSIPVKRGDFVARRLALPGGREHAIPVATIVGEALDSSGAPARDAEPPCDAPDCGGGEHAIADLPAETGGFFSARAILIARPETLEYVFIIPSRSK